MQANCIKIFYHSLKEKGIRAVKYFASSGLFGRDQLKNAFRLGRVAARGLPAGHKGQTYHGKQIGLRLVILVAVQKIPKGLFEFVGIHQITSVGFYPTWQDIAISNVIEWYIFLG